MYKNQRFKIKLRMTKEYEIFLISIEIHKRYKISLTLEEIKW